MTTDSTPSVLTSITRILPSVLLYRTLPTLDGTHAMSTLPWMIWGKSSSGDALTAYAYVMPEPFFAELSSGSAAPSVGMPEVVSIILTRPMVVGPFRDATRTTTSSVAFALALDALAPPDLEESDADESLAPVPQPARMPVRPRPASVARASRRVMFFCIGVAPFYRDAGFTPRWRTVVRGPPAPAGARTHGVDLTPWEGLPCPALGEWRLPCG